MNNRFNYKSRTNKSIFNIPEDVLKVRSGGVSLVKSVVGCSTSVVGDNSRKDSAINLIASMNYTVRDCERELKRRKQENKNNKTVKL